MTLFWVGALALTILLYVLLDGFDLGVGILFLFSRDEMNRRSMLAAIAPVWDGNETWLVLTAAILFGAFSRVFALALSAFYLPVIVGVCALVLRGVSFEFRSKARTSRRLWDAAFAGGSLVATFVQGAALGALVAGLPVQSGQYTGGTFGWLSSFSVLCGVGLCIGYALLGVGWLIKSLKGVSAMPRTSYCLGFWARCWWNSRSPYSTRMSTICKSWIGGCDGPNSCCAYRRGTGSLGDLGRCVAAAR